ncbi:MAG TPA: putative DNA-binding domain-containing protein, partial [Alphaproteobacteria bacterium]|nr:putative DNA-binding domain-containing protein [Alphaproteobacteria bacterium]
MAEPGGLTVLQRHVVDAVHGDPAGFAAALTQVRPGRIDARKRLYLHRNTVRAGLLAVLRQAFPVVAAVLGRAGFEAAAGAFIDSSPPRRAMLSA